MDAAHADARRGVRLEQISVLWIVVEAIVSLGAGIAAASLLLTAFGIDSLIELGSAVVLLRRLAVEARDGETERVERSERQAQWVVALALALLCLYVLGTALYGLATQAKPENSPIGIAVAALAVVVMPGLAVAKRRLADRLDSGALRGDAASSLTCGYLAGAVLIGLVLNGLFDWWWAEDVAAFAFLVWLIQETREAIEEAGAGHP